MNGFSLLFNDKPSTLFP